MSKRFFIKSVGNIDDELLERFNEIDNRLSQKRSYKPLILKISAIAACFCVIIGSVLGAMYFTGDETPGDQSDYTEYDQFENRKCGLFQQSVQKHALGPTSLGVSFIYMIISIKH